MNGQDLYKRAKQIIPGGTNLFSKRPELYAPDQWPPYFYSAKGCRVVDVDGNVFLDMSTNGLGACPLGYADPDVDGEVIKAIRKGTATSLNAPEEVELAEVMLGGHPWAGGARFARSGGEAISIAVRIARAFTGRSRVIWCGYGGWTDTYMAGGGHLSGLSAKGVPVELEGTVTTARYNHIEDFWQVSPISGPNRPAAIVCETVRSEEPQGNFLQHLRELATSCNIPLILDEISSGYRMWPGGAHRYYGVDPDMAVFAKAISNGYPMSVVLGTAEIMEAAQETFISSTNWTERIGPVAALATIKKFTGLNVHTRLMSIGRKVQNLWKKASDESGVPVTISGIPALSHIDFHDQHLQTFFTQEMLRNGILAGTSFYPTMAHEWEDIYKYGDILFQIFDDIAKGRVVVCGPDAHSGFQRLA